MRALLPVTLAVLVLVLIGTRGGRHDHAAASLASEGGATRVAAAPLRSRAPSAAGSAVARAADGHAFVARLLAPGPSWPFIQSATARQAQGSSSTAAARPGAAPAPAGSARHTAEALARLLAAPEYAANVAPVARLYLAAFDRLPDYEAFEHYVGERGRGARLAAIADQVVTGPEFVRRYGNLDNAAFVDRIRHNVLGEVQMRPGWREAWAEQLDSGHLTRGEVMIALSESPEFRAVSAHEVFVSMAYAQALQRAPEPMEVTRWVDFLDAGNSREAMLAEMLAENGER